MFRFLLVGLAVLTVTAQAQYSLWPSGVDADSLAASIGVSIGCFTALNETVSCDAVLFKRTKSPDYFFWSTDNVTDLCTSDCQESATAWSDLVLSSCANETIFYNNMAVPADSISGRHVEGLNLACMTNSQGSSCLVESQDWVGSGMVYEADGTLSDDQSFTRLYDNATLCDDCFVGMLVARMNSSFLAESEYNTYVTAELGSVLDWCGQDSNITLKPYATYTSTSGPPDVLTSSASASSVSAAAPTCTGQIVDVATTERLLKRQLLSGASATSNANISQACLDYSVEYEVPTGSIVIASGNSTCSNVTAGTCLPGSCEIAQVTSAETTCDLLAAGLTVAGGSVTIVQLLTWNPTIIGTCDSLLVGQYVCISPPGGSWTPVIANITSTAGDGGGVTATFSSGALTGTPTNGIATPTPIQTGMTTSCDVFYKVRTGDTCDSVATEYNIALADFYAWNPAVGADCISLELGVYVCVDTLGSSATSTSTSSNTISTPSPVQTGIPSSCDEFHYVVSGDTCQAVADEYDISIAQFYAWNPAVGSSCEYLELDTYVCVDVTVVISTPSPVQTGISSTCDEFHYVVSGDTCQALAATFGVSLAQFYAWNPAVGSSCQYLELDTYVCVDVEGVTATPTASSISTPSPVQTGMVTDCDAFYFVTAGDGCAAIASKEDIATSSFYAWNPAVGTACADLYLSYYVCVGVEPSTTAVAARAALATAAASDAAEKMRHVSIPLITPAPRRLG